MALNSGSTVGHYQILGVLGAGGMGEVYRARDTKLGREVALKILPVAVSADPERRARFAREARALAALNHPHIAQVYGFEDSEPTSALIMELVDGEDLSERIRRGPLPFDDAIAIARQIGEALQAAHDRGIIHRDLKPANIKLRDDGTVKVLDFGLAKALDQGSGIGDQGSGNISHSPTITTPAMTLQGVILGTAAYMAPEQAKGRVVDKRADIWAFGCVLYEMLTGRKAFAGDDVSDTLASILKSDVDWNGVPPRAARLLKKCLEKDPRKRLHDVGDAWDLLDEAPAAAGAAGRSQWLPWSLAVILAIGTIGLAALRVFDAPPVPARARFQVPPPPKQEFGVYLSLSPDGRRLAFTTAGPAAALWVRDLESLEARPLPDTEGATSPFWSPDGRFIAFAVGPALKKIDISGGPPQKIADAETNVGVGAWNASGIIVFGTRGLGPIYRVAATGGTPVALTSLDQTRVERGHSFPLFLRDGKRFLYMRLSNRPDVQGVFVGSIERTPDQQDPNRLLSLVLGPLAVIDSRSGTHLLFMRDGTVMAQRFDAERVQISGDAQPLAERVGSAGSFAYFAVGGDVLTYREGTSTATNLEQLAWVSRKGETLGKVGEPQPLDAGPLSLEIAPNGRRAALVVVRTLLAPDVWVMEFDRGLATRMTFTDEGETGSTWSPDGRHLVFRSGRGGRGLDLFVKDVDGTDEEKSIAASPMPGLPNDWSPDGRFLVFTRAADPTNLDLFAFSSERKAAEPLLQTAFSESMARLSADGRWLAYQSNESGQNEIYVRPFVVSAAGKASVGPKWRVSTSGGVVPRWRGDGKELFYRTPAGEFMAVDVKAAAGTVETALPRRLFAPVSGVHAWDVAADGQRFLMGIPLRSDVQATADPLTVVLNWKSALAR